MLQCAAMFFTTENYGDYNKIIWASRLTIWCLWKKIFAMFCSNFIICKIYGKIIGKHGITSFNQFLTKLLIGFNETEIGTLD